MKCFVCVPYNACSSEYNLDEMSCHHSLTAAQEQAERYIVDMVADEGFGTVIAKSDCKWRVYNGHFEPVSAFYGEMSYGDDIVYIYDVPLLGFE